MSRGLRAALWLSSALALGGCASALSCTATSIVVAAKEERTRMRMEPGGLTTTPSGYVRETYREVSVIEYWLRDDRGHWDRVTPAAWKTAEVGRHAEVCR